jgi:hypothetical protein
MRKEAAIQIIIIFVIKYKAYSLKLLGSINCDHLRSEVFDVIALLHPYPHLYVIAFSKKDDTNPEADCKWMLSDEKA